MDSGLAMQTENALANARAAPTVKPSGDYAKMRKTAENLEAFFLGQMLQPMFNNIEAAAPFGGGNSERMWRSMQVEEFGKAFARMGGVGLADSIMKEMLRLQEGK